MPKIEVKNKEGKKVSTIELADDFIAARPVDHVIHRTVVAEMANSRQGTQSAKTRSEVRGGGKKPYKQKKTGNARQGTTRAPHYAHGGMALAVKPRDYDKKVNKKERRLAILGAIADKVSEGKLHVADAIVFAEPKTKNALDMLKALALDGSRRLLVILEQVDEPTFKSFRNLPNVTVKTAPAAGGDTKTSVFSARDVVVAHDVLIAQGALNKIQEVWAK
jgi:large subunit ribosomal protein L4